MTDLLNIDKTIIEFMGGRFLQEDPDCYEFVYKTSEGSSYVKRFYATEMKFYANWTNLMRALDYVEQLGFSSIIQDETCTIIPKTFNNIRITHTERRDTKQWAIYHCIFNFIKKYRNFTEKGVLNGN